MKRMAFVSVTAVWTAFSACGAWSTNTMPLGGLDIDESSGLPRQALEQELDRIAAENAAAPFVVTRTKWLAAVFSNARLAMNCGDEFVHWHPDSDLLALRFRKRMEDFAASKPERRHCGKWVWSTKGAWMGRLDTSHTCPDWESILSLGVKGLADRARARRQTAATDDERLFIDCVAEAYDAMRGLCRRWADLAAKRGSAACADALRALADRPPRTFREALQLALLYDRCQETEGECVRSQGLFDRLFLKYYRDDLASGRETRASAKRLVAAYFTAFYVQNHPNGKNIALGGFGRGGKPVWNELTELALELHDELNRPNPKFSFRVGAQSPEDQIDRLAHSIASGRTSIVFASEECLKKMFARQGVEAADVADCLLIGCYEPGVQGREVIASMATEVNLAKPLETALNGGRDFAGEPSGVACAFPADVAAFEEEYFRQLRHMTDAALAATVECERNWYELNPSPVMSGASRDAVAAAKDCGCGGMKYNQSGVVFVGLATAADSIAAMRELVASGAVSLPRMAEVLKADWKDAEELRLRARRSAPKWGNNDDRADAIARQIFAFACAAANGKPNGHGGTFQVGFWSIDRDIPFGVHTGATPDGRKAGEPVSRNNSATAGCGREGVTALLASQLRMDQAACADGFISDVILPAGAADVRTGSKLVRDVLRTYFAGGGQCIHFNCFSAKVLREAMADPKRHPDLQVRVCGWNVRWNDLSRTEQLHFLATVEAQERH